MAINSSDILLRLMPEVNWVRQPVCLRFPPKVSSPGLAALHWEANNKTDNLLDFSGPTLYVQMVITFVLTQVFDVLLKPLGLPAIFSQILAGIMLGPMIFKDQTDSLITISEDSVQILGTIGSLGYTFFVFLVGVKMDLSMMYKSGKKAVYIGVLTVLVPLVFNLTAIHTLSPDDKKKGLADMIEDKSFLYAMINSNTAFPVIHIVLSELRMLNTELGRLAISASLISDFVALALRVVAHWARISLLVNPGIAAVDFVMGAIFFAIMIYVIRPMIKWMVKHTPEGGQIKDVYLYTIILFFMMTPKISTFISSFFLFAPFLLGLVVPAGSPLATTLVDKFDPIVSGLILPLFASTCGMRLNIIDYIDKFQPSSIVNIKAALVANIVKFGVTFALPKLCNMPTRDSLALAFIMITKGIVEIAAFSFLNDSMYIPDDLYNIMTISHIVLATIMPPIVKRLYDPARKYVSYQRRSIMHSKFNEELRMISCIHVPADVNSIINIMNVFCPINETPIALDVLHLVKLNGRATPLFITHQKNMKIVSNKSYSENVVLSFDQFERENWEVVSVNVFTAVSPPNSMFEDVWNLALNKLTSFILLPFHRRWSIDGSIESEDQAIRSLNCSILEKAPCSVGILVEGCRTLTRSDPGKTLAPNSSSYNIAVIFLGASDDREALALAKRITLDKWQVSLTVIHLKATKCSEANCLDEDDTKLDDEVLKDIQESRYIRYVEEHVNDGPETSSFLRSIVSDYQLILVGRRYNKKDPQTLGLEQWSEFKEIGIIGDLLSSTDFGGNYSLLIVQQQRLNIV